jgi:hypothetical protein
MHVIFAPTGRILGAIIDILTAVCWKNRFFGNVKLLV